MICPSTEAPGRIHICKRKCADFGSKGNAVQLSRKEELFSVVGQLLLRVAECDVTESISPLASLLAFMVWLNGSTVATPTAKEVAR